MQEKNDKFINSLRRGLSLLSILSRSSSLLSLTEISHQLHLQVSTVQRLTYTLRELGYLNRDEETKKYSLGPGAFSLGASIIGDLDLRKIAYPYMEKASKKIGEVVNLGILDGTETVYVERIKTEQLININLNIGSRFPAFCTSVGKAILAFLPEDRLEEVLNKTEFIPFTSNTIKDREELKQELDRVRTRGFAINNEEDVYGIRTVAAPVRDFRGEVNAAVNFSVPSVRVSKRKLETDLARKITETANKISFAFGYREETQ